MAALYFMMTPDDILESLDGILKKYDEVELILLKGHLILEQALNDHLSHYISDQNKLDRLNLMFSKKLDLLVALEGDDYLSFRDGVKHLKEINRIRNKLAHTLEFENFESDLKAWACSVVGYTPKTIDKKSTYRNTVIKAFYFLTGYLVGNSVGKSSVRKNKI